MLRWLRKRSSDVSSTGGGGREVTETEKYKSSKKSSIKLRRWAGWEKKKKVGVVGLVDSNSPPKKRKEQNTAKGTQKKGVVRFECSRVKASGGVNFSRRGGGWRAPRESTWVEGRKTLAHADDFEWEKRIESLRTEEKKEKKHQGGRGRINTNCGKKNKIKYGTTTR